MGDGTQEFDGVALFLERIVRGGGSLDDYFGSPQLERLFRVRCEDEFSRRANRGADIQVGNFGIIIEIFGIKDDLKVFESAPVIEFDETKILHIAHGTHPTADNGILRRKCLRSGINFDNFCSFHINFLHYVSVVIIKQYSLFRKYKSGAQNKYGENFINYTVSYCACC